MFRFLLFVLVVGGVALYFTNPTTDDVRAQLTQLGGVPASAPVDLPAGPPASAPDDQSGIPPASAPDAQIGIPPVGAPGDQPGMPTTAVPGLTDRLTGVVQLERKDYYLFSVYKVSAGGQQLPGCLIGIAKQVVPYDKCPS